MCTYYYLHHHHISPCTRDIDIVVHYVFCSAAGTSVTQSTDHSSPFSPSSSTSTPGAAGKTDANSTTAAASNTSHPAIQTPCSNLYFDPSQSVDYSDPCASGGCLASPDCSSGACRLEQLNGRWTCCRCGQGGN